MDGWHLKGGRRKLGLLCIAASPHARACAVQSYTTPTPTRSTAVALLLLLWTYALLPVSIAEIASLSFSCFFIREGFGRRLNSARQRHINFHRNIVYQLSVALEQPRVPFLERSSFIFSLCHLLLLHLVFELLLLDELVFLPLPFPFFPFRPW